VKRTGPTREVEQLVIGRAAGHCERCGHGLGNTRGVDWSMHHRRPRSMGGTRAPWINQPSNLVIICGSGTSPGCHADVESHRAKAYTDGWLIRMGFRPAEVSVPLHGHGLVLLDDVGTWTAVS
jgi:hypothetical protein